MNSCIGTPTYRLSKHLASILKHLQSKSGYPVKNPKEFADFISGQRIANGMLIVSFDVVSLLSSISVDVAIRLVKQKLKETGDWRVQTEPDAGSDPCSAFICVKEQPFRV